MVENGETLGKISTSRSGRSRREGLICKRTDPGCIAGWVLGASEDDQSGIDATWWRRSLGGNSASQCYLGRHKGLRLEGLGWSNRGMGHPLRSRRPEGGLFGQQEGREICYNGPGRFWEDQFGIGWRRDGRTSGCGRRTRVIRIGSVGRWRVPNASRLVSAVCPVSEVGCRLTSSSDLRTRVDKDFGLS